MWTYLRVNIFHKLHRPVPRHLNWFLSATGSSNSGNPVPIDEETEIGVYRKDDGTDKVQLAVNDETRGIGILDRSVSRMREDGPPVRISRQEDKIKIHNIDNASAIDIDAPGSQKMLKRGEESLVSNDCTVKVGYNTELLLISDFASPESDDRAMVEQNGNRIPLSAHVRVQCQHLQVVSHNSVSEVRNSARDLYNIIKDHPLDRSGYKNTRDRLRQSVESLEMEDSSDNLKNDRIAKLKEIAEDIERLYARE